MAKDDNGTVFFGSVVKECAMHTRTSIMDRSCTGGTVYAIFTAENDLNSIEPGLKVHFECKSTNALSALIIRAHSVKGTHRCYSVTIIDPIQLAGLAR